MYKLLLFSILTLFLFSCNNSKNKSTDSIAPAKQRKAVSVETKQVVKQTFNSEIVSNGKVHASHKAYLKFRKDGLLKVLSFKNGDIVHKGQLIAQLENTIEKNQLQQAKASFKEIELKLFDLIVSSGGEYGDTTKISKNKLNVFKINSGYFSALSRKQFAEIQYSHTFLYAPFTGIVADIDIKPYNMVSSVTNICTILSKSNFEVEFPLLENEAVLIEKEFKVIVIPFYNDTVKLQAKISEINPVVNTKGFIKTKAELLPTQFNIFDGMNVRVIIQKEYPDCLVVPKSAVVTRSGRNVVFTYQDGLAKWNYVTLGMENQNEYTITDGLKDSMMIIYTGNLNLAHDAPVKILH